MSVFFSTIMGSMAMGQIAPPLTAFTAAKAAISSILEVVNRTPTIDGLSTEGLEPLGRPAGKVELTNVEFAYPSRPDIQVCKGYSLTINPGETVALVGASGCGKSTIINLLLRFYDPQAGQIELDGVSIKSVNIGWLRKQMGYVGQEPILFAGTIADNIAYGLNITSTGNMTAEDAEKLNIKIVEAAKLANAHEFICNFPQGAMLPPSMLPPCNYFDCTLLMIDFTLFAPIP